MAEKLARLRSKAAERGRHLSFGIRLHVIVRETEEQAWRDAEALIEHVDDAAILHNAPSLVSIPSVSSRMHGGRRDGFVVAPNLWAGVGLVRGGVRHRIGQ